MLAAIDWNQVLAKAVTGGIIGGVAGGCVGLVWYLVPKSNENKQERAGANGRARPPAKALPPLVLFFFIAAVTFVPFVVEKRFLNALRVRVSGDATAPTVTISDYGRYRVAGPDRATPGGAANAGEREYVLLEQTDQVPCRVGETWGVRIRGSVAPQDDRSHLVREEIHHPPIKHPDGSVRTTDAREFRTPPGAAFGSTNCWQFLKGHEHELVPGDWTWVVFVDGVEVARRTFRVWK
ncbi:hypothetical protein GobsT_08980 [Gemmata obscuriglobus]|uniref:DUF3859 domain-containing protein n=1 Tax=Gemmata obscuriglobus TaxID=114 RepID=A0A2Z3H856_9BACT